MKKIYITESQLKKALLLNETINQTVNKLPGESLDTAVRNAAREVNSEAPNADVNFIIPKDEVNEDGGSDIVENVVNYIITHWYDEFENESLTMSEVGNMVDEAYSVVAGSELNDNSMFRNIMFRLRDAINKKRMRNESYVITKQQIKEARKNAKINECVKCITKKELIDEVKKS